ncbi:hypothetical protein M514_03736 [Trichuris suis]|uniref:Structure-specific endonuclease subunit SLX1 homolog n=1 Tax=Trichuris suis TaxID=68888 RepID=A0A085MDV0_9BILA|nr:hypothetical protein M513_03736 [Trichuris suis]KFD68722.1 hypothetical protein M514_03736 [Trichuris suis]KHJ42632.1 GIY-YIG catalytic domain protein [Trichuris suis]
MARSSDFYGCYLLVSESSQPRFRGRCYVGFTVNPNRRIKQHNRGRRFGGAFRTSDRGPWEMALLVHGFPNEICALRFEWAWQHPAKSRRLSQLNLRKRAKETKLQFHVRIANHMLSTGPWNRLPLTVRWLNEKYRQSAGGILTTPPHIKVVYGLLEEIDCSTKRSKDVTTVRDICSVCNGSCQGSLLSCLSDSCSGMFHVLCLGKLFSLEEPDFIIPISGRCPLCCERFLWGEWLSTIINLRTDLTIEDSPERSDLSS